MKDSPLYNGKIGESNGRKVVHLTYGGRIWGKNTSS